MKKHLAQPLWGEIRPSDLTAIRPAHDPQRARPLCTVTAYVGGLFDWIFSEGVQVIEPGVAPDDESEGSLSDDDLVTSMPVDIPHLAQSTPKHYSFHHEEYGKAKYPRFTTQAYGEVRVGDVVELARDTETKWKNSTQQWYAFVTDRSIGSKGLETLKILWLYWPEDLAMCMSMKYPFSNEVCLS